MTTPRTGNSRIDYTASGKALQTGMDRSPAAAINRHREFLGQRIAQISRWVTQGVRPEALVRFALMDMDGEKGAKLRECSEQSIYLGLLACAVTGLEPGALKGEAYLVPYAKQATFLVGYKGLIKQARRTRDIKAIAAQVVFERDHFELDLGTANRIVHRPAMRDRGDIVGAYAIARLSSGVDEIEWMDRADLNAVRGAGNNGPAWSDWEDQMYRKAPYRRLCKRLPLGADYYVGLALDEAENASEQARVIDPFTDGEGGRSLSSMSTSAEIAAQAGGMPPDEAAEIERQEREAAKGGK